MNRMRTFLAVPLIAALRDRLVDLQKRLARTAPDVKWTEADNLHITLLFLGEVNNVEIPRVCALAREAVAGVVPFTLSFEKLGAFPNERRPKIFWVGVGTGASELVGIHALLEPPFFELGYRKEDRQYTPHVTIGRAMRDVSHQGVSTVFARHGDWKGGTMDVKEIEVMSSELRPGGPCYTTLSRISLSGVKN